MIDIKKYISNEIKNSIPEINQEITFDNPKDQKHGDLTTNIALVYSKLSGKKPRDLALEISEKLNLDKNLISKTEIAGPGFINFFISDDYYRNILNDILANKNNFGKSTLNENNTANLEWVSANPTKPLHAGHGRQICLGKAIANLLEWTGYKVTREYYYNDAGNQMNKLAESVYARYMQIFNPEFPFPEDGYQGEYIKNIAQLINGMRKDALKNTFKNEEGKEFFKTAGEKYNFKIIRNTLNKLGINHDIFFNESDLYKNGDIEKLIEKFKSNGLAYEKEGALWLKMDEADGFDKDKVIVKSTGEPTYRLPDMAYHIDKINRGYDLILDIFGSDHGDTYKEVLYGVKSAGYDISKIKVIIHQMVTFKMGNESVKMSGRSDTSYYLDELIDDIGADATQFFFVMRGANTHLDFDIKLAKEQSDKNPVYYLQYAYARICGIFRNAETNFPDLITDNIDTKVLKTDEEINLLKTLSRFPEEVEDSASTFEPHKIITYLNKVASDFHTFYHNNRVLDVEQPELSKARLQLAQATKTILKNGFDIIGISSPERM
ncbi:MAG TPA: arginine--tRNA ligase [Ignavibacteria bacterium]|nr:arginine--tRNA ligase [Ignavibacteria bacterium]